MFNKTIDKIRDKRISDLEEKYIAYDGNFRMLCKTLDSYEKRIMHMEEDVRILNMSMQRLEDKMKALNERLVAIPSLLLGKEYPNDKD